MKVGTAIAVALMAITGSAQALTVSKEVGPLIQEAQQMVADKNFESATAKLNEAEAVKAYPDDETVISQIRQFIAVCSNAGTRCDGRRVTGSQP